jgi:hypothetical protein
MKARKQATRGKIQLGGLVVKTGLKDEDKDVLLGPSFRPGRPLNTTPGRDIIKRERTTGVSTIGRARL